MTNKQTSLEQNKAIVKAFWEAFSDSRFDDALGLLADDGTWWVAGSTNISGTYSKSEFANLVGGVAESTENGIRMTPKFLTAEDDRVAMEAESYGPMKNGKVYQNIYHIQHVIRDGKIAAVREYMDTEHVTDVFGS
jgi:ketosteroid isomerase-like protein